MLPMNDYVAIRATKQKERTEGGLYIPETANAENAIMEGEVIAIGKGRTAELTGQLIATTIKVGTKVVFRKFEALKVTVEHEEFIFIREPNIIAIV